MNNAQNLSHGKEDNKMKTTFKIWASIEVIDEKQDRYADLTELGILEPICIGAFDSLETAWAYLLDLPGCQTHAGDPTVLKRTKEIEPEIWTEARAP